MKEYKIIKVKHIHKEWKRKPYMHLTLDYLNWQIYRANKVPEWSCIEQSFARKKLDFHLFGDIQLIWNIFWVASWSQATGSFHWKKYLIRCKHHPLTPRDRKMFQRASNAGVNFFLPQVKFVPNFTRFCRKNKLCRDFALLGGIF